jgi:hypothetical protein
VSTATIELAWYAPVIAITPSARAHLIVSVLIPPPSASRAASDPTAAPQSPKGECVKLVVLFGRAQKGGYHSLSVPSAALAAKRISV